MRMERYLVIGKRGRKIEARRITVRRPALGADEALVRLSFEIPDDAFDDPIVTTQITKAQIAVAVEAEDA